MTAPEPVVMLDPLPADRLARIAACAPARFTLHAGVGRSEAEQIAAITSARFAISGQIAVPEPVMRAGAAAGLRAVHKWGVGYDNIAVDVARSRGVRILRTTGSNALPVAETALGLILGLYRGLVTGHTTLASGAWRTPVIRGHALLSGRTVGLIGVGAIGGHLARLLAPFGCRLLYSKPTPLADAEAATLGLTHVPLATLLAEADIVSLHCPSTPQTRGMMDAIALAAMKPGALLVNTARGDLWDEAAVAAALDAGHLGGAACDVFVEEPPSPDHPLIGRPDVIATPHIAAAAAEIFAPTIERMFANFALIADGAEPPAGDIVV